MNTELEAKFLDIDSEGVRVRLRALGAVLIHEERLMRRRNYDFPDVRLAEKNAWVRVRDEGDKVTISYKQVDDKTKIDGTRELEMEVSDFDAACAMMEAIGLKTKSYQETRREKWSLDEADITLDSWPWIPMFLEIEAKNETLVTDIARKLGFDMKDAFHGSAVTAYKEYFDLDSKTIWSQPEFRFGLPCPWNRK